MESIQNQVGEIEAMLQTKDFTPEGIIALTGNLHKSIRIQYKQDKNRLEELARLLMRCFSYMQLDREAYKDVILHLSNLLFKIYFSLNTKSLCNNLLRVIEAPNKSELIDETTNTSILITNLYYRARLCISKENFDLAEEMLDRIILLCPMKECNNRRRTLTYLICIKIIKGILPTTDCLKKYNLEFLYNDLVLSIKKGNIKMFDSIVENLKDYLIAKELYLTINIHIRTLIWRNLFKITYKNVIASGGDMGRMELGYIIQVMGNGGDVNKDLNKNIHKESGDEAVEKGNIECDIDEIECITATLIDLGYIKGYISHEKSLLVLSKKNPFPRLI
eukprot:GHVP01027969.1.p1 GENE.GHVP01027969.1~~GHVP01027969.1.p1  ORF type:complete len:334 (-),score=40.64 GHVP01027969.1:22-1023(-)